MTLPFSLPDWVPWWVPLVLLVPALLYALAFLFMPFSVLGVKSRLEAIEMQLEEIRHQLRLIGNGLSGGQREMDFEDVYAPAAMRGSRQEPVINDRAPIPPTAQDYYEDEGPFERPAPAPNARPQRPSDPPVVRGPRAEPRLDRRR
ncbi:MAG TPA: hypothetical protein VHB27_19440 [Rhodopila sp.]|uniref:hypothetical protein n=1 Tax=Rhodopila sp. TaxID=2480087 RepID=UPI002C0D1F7F|nr:hypothetical protein [Rhodopila sp.]HVY17405.1 hypothetical protein [Rhodopila sp.]